MLLFIYLFLLLKYRGIKHYYGSELPASLNKFKTESRKLFWIEILFPDQYWGGALFTVGGLLDRVQRTQKLWPFGRETRVMGHSDPVVLGVGQHACTCNVLLLTRWLSPLLHARKSVLHIFAVTVHSVSLFFFPIIYFQFIQLQFPPVICAGTGFVDFGVFVVWWLVCGVAGRRVEVCFSSPDIILCGWLGSKYRLTN